jgi:hypothetical protein
VPDWTTQTEWDFPRPDPRLIQPVTSVDTGNRPLNFLLNKMLLPWANALLFLENIPLATLIGVDDALKHSPFQSEYQVASDMMPLEGAMGLAMEIGPALDYAATSLSTNQGLRALVTAPAYSFMGAGGVGGGTTLGSLTAETKAAGNLTELSELSALGEFRGQRATIQDIQDLLQELKDADIQVISVKGVNEWAQTEREALRVYHEVNQDTGLFTEAGDAFHEAVRAASGGETGPDRIDFNFVNEIKTSAGHPGLRIFTKALKAGERHAVEGLYDGAVVTVYDVLNRVKYFVQRAP